MFNKSRKPASNVKKQISHLFESLIIVATICNGDYASGKEEKVGSVFVGDIFEFMILRVRI